MENCAEAAYGKPGETEDNRKECHRHNQKNTTNSSRRDSESNEDFHQDVLRRRNVMLNILRKRTCF